MSSAMTSFGWFWLSRISASSRRNFNSQAGFAPLTSPRKIPGEPCPLSLGRHPGCRADSRCRCFDTARPGPRSPCRWHPGKPPADSDGCEYAPPIRLVVARAAAPAAAHTDFAIDRATQLGADRHQLNRIARDQQLAENDPAKSRNFDDVATASMRARAFQAIHQGTQNSAARTASIRSSSIHVCSVPTGRHPAHGVP